MVSKKIVGIVGAVALIALVGFLAFGNQIPLFSMTISSITHTPNIISNQAELEQAEFRVKFGLSGSGENLVGSLTKDAFSYRSGGYEPDYDLRYSAETHDQFAIYDIINQGEPIWGYDKSFVDCWFPATCDCPPGTDYKIVAVADPLGLRRNYICITKNQVGTKGVFAPIPDIKDEARIKMELLSGGSVVYTSYGKDAGVCSDNGQPECITNFGAQSLNYYDSQNNWVGNIKFDGSTVTGQAPPPTAGYIAVYPDSTQNWVIAREPDWDGIEGYIGKSDALEEYLAFAEQGVGFAWDITCGINVASPAADCYNKNIAARLDAANNKASALVLANYSFTGNYLDLDVSGELNQGEVIVLLDRYYSSPTFVGTLKATWLGIEIPVGQPQIIEPVPTLTMGGAGQEQTMFVNVKNIGTASGQFAGELKNCPNFTLITSDKFPASAGQTITMPLTISKGTYAPPSQTTHTCRMRVFEFNYPDNSDEADVTIVVVPEAVCVPGAYDAPPGQKTIYRCKADGSGWELVAICADDERITWVNGVPTCVKVSPENCGNGQIDTGEDCDGIDLGDATCQSIGLGDGILTCIPGACMFDSSQCGGEIPSPCEDGQIYKKETGLCEECVDLPADGIFVLGRRVIQENTQNCIFGTIFGCIIPGGITSEQVCVVDYNWLMILGIIVAIIVAIIMAVIVVRRVI